MRPDRPQQAPRVARTVPPWLERLGRLDRFTRLPRLPRSPRSRTGRRIRWAIVIGLAAVALLYAVTPAVAMYVARQYLPRTVTEGLVITDVTTIADGAPVNLAVYMRPGRTRRLIEAAQGVWLPPWSLRSGQNASGRVDIGDAPLSLSWRTMITTREEHPTVILRLRPEDAAGLIEPYSNVTLDPGRGMGLTYAIDRATITTEKGPEALPDVWNLRLEGEGRIGVTMGPTQLQVEVSRMVGHLRVWFHRVDRGWNPDASITIDLIEAKGTDYPFITSKATRRQLEAVVTANLKRRLRDVVLPAYFPTDVVLTGSVDPDAPTAGRPP